VSLGGSGESNGPSTSASGAATSSSNTGTSGGVPGGSATTSPGHTPRPTAPPPIPVPADLTPSIAAAPTDSPVIYSDGCHLGFLATNPPPCLFGDRGSGTSVVLFGDSLAGQWFPALEQLASTHHWRLESLTKSACPAADVTPWSSALGRPYTECDTWRQNVLDRIAREHPAAVVISDDRLYQLAINGRQVPVAKALPTWYAGLDRTLREVAADASDVVLIGATPRSRVDPPVCLAKHLDNMLACATPAKVAIDQGRLAMDRQTATGAGASFIDASPWVCPSDPCLPVLGTTLAYREADHMTATFALELVPKLEADLKVPG
jgi:hypothetical protein